ncbi:MAG: 16S rRNA (cytidine(1402)-2'-O)-methyltransferase [Bryobacteraceae bacterium]
MAATLYLVSTPIGNLEDITLRALRILREEVSRIACEDTRQTKKLLEHYQIRKPLVSYHEHNEASRTAELLTRLESGESVALLSDAGTPLVSDPGYRLVQAAIAHRIPVVPLPGASAALSALIASGLPCDEFRFIGFLPPKQHARRKLLDTLRSEPATTIAYESPHRILDSLADIAEVLGPRPVVVARELTKLYEELLRGNAASILAELKARNSVKGEITLVIGGGQNEIPANVDPVQEVARLQSEEGLERMEAIKTVAKLLGLPKREVYRLVEEEQG